MDVRPTLADRWYVQSVPVSGTGERALFVVLRSSSKEIGQWNPSVTIDALRFERGR